MLVQQVQKNASLVEHAISTISHAKACAGPPAGNRQAPRLGARLVWGHLHDCVAAARLLCVALH